MAERADGAASKKKAGILWVLIIQLCVGVYSFSGVMAKMASGYAFFSAGFFGFYGAELLCLGVYAIAWQQILKRVDLSIAYSNRAIAILWMMLWSLWIFKEGISVQNICGVALILGGVVLVNSDDR
jgi:multidrug transporter EmrE-like cation transporter